MVESQSALKLRLVREAIQHNIHRSRSAKGSPAPSRPSAILFSVWIASALVVASLVYLAVPPQVGSRERAAATDRAPSGAGAGQRVPAVADAASAAAVGAQTASLGSQAPGSEPQHLGRALLPLSVKRIVLDPGHGGAQHGATAESGLAEKDITLDIALRLRRLLKDTPLEVLMTRETDVTISLDQRADYANAQRADLFVSIHINWIPRREIRPIETYFVGPTDDPATLALARKENRESGYSLASYRRLLEKVYTDARRDESHALARAINGELYRSLAQINPAMENRGVKMAPFAVLVGTEMPAILVEVSCLSNEEEVDLLTKAEYRERIAAALVRGIRSYASDLERVGRKEG
jgi:N-acetylmuramoyl-L-alanine amidase